jgi:hypothetical protein
MKNRRRWSIFSHDTGADGFGKPPPGAVVMHVARPSCESECGTPPRVFLLEYDELGHGIVYHLNKKPHDVWFEDR